MPESRCYTGKGDHGDTARLGETARLPKDSALIEAIGAVDEASSAIGLARATMHKERLCQALQTTQRHLSRLMTHLAATPDLRMRYPGLAEGDLQWLENLIGELEQDLPPLHKFVLPGDSSASAACHMARAIVRRAERTLVTLTTIEPDVGAVNLAYLNRLSSFLFIVALCEDQAV